MSGQGSGGGGALVVLLVFWVVAVFIVVGPVRDAPEEAAVASVLPSVAPSPTPDLTFGIDCDSATACEEPVTRAEMAGALDVALDLPVTTANSFTDDDGTEHEASINRMAAAGLIGGCDDSRFCPDDGATRAQLAAILVRSFDLPAGTEDAFGDDDGHPHEGAINAVAAAGFSGGCGERTFCPNNPVSRQELRELLGRITALAP